MIEIKTKLMRWGNSFGVVIPISKVQSANLNEGEEVRALIIQENKTNLRKLFGKHKFSKPTDRLMRETDKELYNE
jgi:antitoxin component of MazEF toxin-antitoxin module